MTFDDQLDLERTDEGRALRQGWDTYVRGQQLADVYWDPTDHRWETYAADRFSFTRTSIRRQDPAQMWSTHITLGEVLAPRDPGVRWIGDLEPPGRLLVPLPARASRPAPSSNPDWVVRMNAQLSAIDNNDELSPEEKHAARIAIIDSYT
jgi:hypothetical protein